MPLGKQFQNTFFEGAGGKLTHYTDPQTLPAPTPNEHGVTDITGTADPGKPRESETGHPGVAYQGMLFTPHAFTGLKSDPTIPEEKRKETITKALRLDPDTYKANAKGQVGAKENLEGHRKAILEAADKTDIPTHMFENNIDVSTVVSKKLGRNTGGDFSRAENRIRTRARPSTEVVGTESYTEQPFRRGEGYIENPNHEKDNEKISYALGSTKTLRMYSGTYESQHIFPGEGKATDEYDVHNMKIHNGYTDTGRRKSAKVHVRIPKIAVGEPIQRTRTLYADGFTSSSSTIAHEIGHSMDPNLKAFSYFRNPRGADTVHEAVADGVEDRFVGHAGQYEHTLHPSPERAQEFKTRGYSIKDSQVAGNNVNKALYAAVRTHVAMGDHNYADVQNRKELYDKAPLPRVTKTSANLSYVSEADPDRQREHANTLLLGHLYTTHAHVRESLTHLGLDHIGESAANHYRTHITDAGNVPLPGFEHHGD